MPGLEKWYHIIENHSFYTHPLIRNGNDVLSTNT